MYFPDRVKVIRKDPNPANMDPHGNRPTLAEVILPCRIDETSKIVKNQQGEEVVSTTQFSFPGRFSVAYYDELNWKDSNGVEATKSPVAVDLTRDIIGAPRLLVVSC